MSDPHLPKSTRRYPISIPNQNTPFGNRPFNTLGGNAQPSGPLGTPRPAAPAPANPAAPRPAQPGASAPYGNRPYQGGGNNSSSNNGRGRRPPGRVFDQTRINDRIRAPKVRVVHGTTNEQLGVMPTAQAIRMAKDEGVDLVEVAPNAEPPVCKIIDYGKYKYALEKQKKEAHKHQKTGKLKELKFRVGIDPHDYQIKMVHAEDFLADGHKVRVQLQFRGRQMAHQNLGFELMKRVKEDLVSMAHVDMEPRQAGRNINMQLSPLPERQRVRKFKTIHRDAKLIDDNSDFEDDDHHDHPEAPPAVSPTVEPVAPPPTPES